MHIMHSTACAALHSVHSRHSSTHLYASISSLTKAVSEREAAQIQRSSTFVAPATLTAVGSKAAPASASQRSTFCTRNLRQELGRGGRQRGQGSEK